MENDSEHANGVRTRYHLKKKGDREGFRSNFLSTNLTRLYDLDDRNLAKIWQEYDMNQHGWLGKHDIEMLIQDCSDMMLNQMRPIFARKYRVDHRDASTDDCNLAFDEMFEVLDIHGSVLVSNAVRKHFLAAMRAENQKDPSISKELFLANWNTFSQVCKLLQTGKIDISREKRDDVSSDDNL